MEQKSKELLIEDLCARLPYGVKVEAKGLLKRIMDDYNNRNIINAHVLNGLNLNDCFKTYSIDCITRVPLFNRNGVCNIKPYLFPLSSMTEEQCYKLASIRSDFQDCWKYIKTPIPLWICNFEQINYFHKNHLDYRGLIPMGLAIDATGLNIY